MAGETCTDEYHYGTCERISPEAPVPIFDYEYSVLKYGMAENVKENLESFNCSVDFLTNDKNLLIKRRLVDIKTKQQILREDFGKKVNSITNKLNKNYDMIVISDYNRGVLSDDYISYLCSFPCPKYVDTKRTDLSCFSNCIIKCNEGEYSKITKFSESSEYIVTKGKDGASWNGSIFSAPPVEIHDVTGAGDVFLSVLSVLKTLTGNMEFSIKNSVRLASISTKHFGIYKLQGEDINEICD